MTVPGASARGRGPSGEAPPPPPWLATAALPIDGIVSGAALHRVHRVAHGPLFFGPGAGVAPTYRFDSASGMFGVLYVGLSLAAALVETLARNPARRMVGYGDIAARASCVVRSGRDLRVVRLHGTGLQQVGCDNAISTGPYDVCGTWADALWQHPEQPDGVAYQSRHDPGELCVALFERADLMLTSEPSAPLVDRLATVSTLLSRYGKSIVGTPV